MVQTYEVTGNIESKKLQHMHAFCNMMEYFLTSLRVCFLVHGKHTGMFLAHDNHTCVVFS